jgi:fructose-1-phosphate kinase PfkB-like protein
MNLQRVVPAGKALNISRALCWMGVASKAAGLWGKSDYDQMIEQMACLGEFVDVKFTLVEGQTRRNVTIVDTQNKREMHLRAASDLANAESLKKLSRDFSGIVTPGAVCVFAGALPEDNLLCDIEGIIRQLSGAGGRIVIDSSGKALKRIVDMGDIWIVKPNIDELRQLVGTDVDDNAADIVAAARQLSSKVGIVLVSRGKKGAIAVGPDFAVEGFITEETENAHSTVACGDYLLAGFIGGNEGLQDTAQVASALGRAIKVATAKALGLCEKMNWADAQKIIDVDIREL